MTTLLLEDERPLYRQLEDILEEKIRTFVFCPGEAIPSERQLCKLYGVSYITVRRAITEMVNKGLLLRRQGRGTFVASSGLAEVDNIGILMFDTEAVAKPYMSMIIRGAEAACGVVGASAQLFPTAGKSLWEPRNNLVRHLILTSKIKGLFLATPVPEEDLVRLMELGLPLMVIQEYKRIACPCVVADMRGSVAELTRHLLANGHRRIALLIRPLDQDKHDYIRMSNEIHAGYTTALAEAGLSYRKNLVAESEFVPAEAQQEVMRLLKQSEPPTALIAAGHTFLEAATKGIADQGLSIPQDISLAGFAEEGYDPNYTAVLVPTRKQGEVGVSRLLQVIRGEPLIDRKLELACDFVSGSTVGQARREGI